MTLTLMIFALGSAAIGAAFCWLATREVRRHPDLSRLDRVGLVAASALGAAAFVAVLSLVVQPA